MPMQSLMALVTELVGLAESGSLRAGFHRPLQRGSANGSVTVLPDPEDPAQLLIVVRMSIRSAPTTEFGTFTATLLELNHRFHGRAAFSLDDLGMVHLTSGRNIEGLDETELVDLILWTTEQADYWDDVLMDSFPS